MAFEDFGALKVEIADWLNREDLEARIPSFVRLFEARANRELRTHDMVKRATAYTDDGFFTVPADWRETIAFMVLDDPDPLTFVNIARSLELRRQYKGVGGPPKFYTHMDGKFFLIPAPSGGLINMELIYRAEVPSLLWKDPNKPSYDVNKNTNWLLEKSPDLYLYGSLVAAEPYLKNDERLPVWKGLADEIIVKMEEEADRASFQQGKLTARFKTFG